jgi:hypothetical protein
VQAPAAERLAAFLAARERRDDVADVPAPRPAGARVEVTESAAMGKVTTVILPARDQIDLRPGAPGWQRWRG